MDSIKFKSEFNGFIGKRSMEPAGDFDATCTEVCRTFENKFLPWQVHSDRAVIINL